MVAFPSPVWVGLGARVVATSAADALASSSTGLTLDPECKRSKLFGGHTITMAITIDKFEWVSLEEQKC